MTIDDLTGGGDGHTPVHPDDLDGLRQRWVTSQGQLDELERANVLAGRQWAFGHRRDRDSVLDDAFLRTVHARTFGDVWSWAGAYRLRATSIGIEPTAIASATRTAMLDARTLLDTAHSRRQQQCALCEIHHRLTVIHPFVNGNGRSSRLLVDIVIHSIGGEPTTWGLGVDGAREQYLAALRRADRGHIDQLCAFMWPNSDGE